VSPLWGTGGNQRISLPRIAHKHIRLWARVVELPTRKEVEYDQVRIRLVCSWVCFHVRESSSGSLVSQLGSEGSIRDTTRPHQLATHRDMYALFRSLQDDEVGCFRHLLHPYSCAFIPMWESRVSAGVTTP